MKTLRSLYRCVVLSFLTVLIAHQPVLAADDELRVFIFAGQSNMVGSDSEDSLVNFGPEFSFGRAVKKTLKQNQTLAIYKFTHSGAQSIDWLPDGTDIPRRDLYKSFIKGIRTAQEDLKRAGYDSELAGVFWHCGENDRALHQPANAYAVNLKTLIDGTRKDLSVPKLKWFITEQPVIPPD